MSLPRSLSTAVLALSIAAAAAPWARALEPSVLTVPRAAQFDSLDPQREFDQASDDVVRQVYSTLLTYAYLERPYRLEPDLLASLPTLGPDHRTYTFRLRHGVHFIDDACFAGGKGRELTSDDVLYSIRRFADANVDTRGWFSMAGAVVGLDEFHAATAEAGPAADTSALAVAGLRRVDRYTFTIRLTRENPLFLYALALPSTAIVPVEAVRAYGDALATRPVGSGPFMATGPLPRQGTIRLLRNPGYYRAYPSTGAPGDAGRGLLADAGKPLPLADVLEMPLIEEAQPAALKFLRGELDRRSVDRASFEQLATRTPDGGFALRPDWANRFDLAVTPAGNLIYINLNLRDPLLGRNKALRQALAAAIDPQAIIDVLWNGRGVALHSVVPVDIAGNEHDTGAPTGGRDLAAAKRLLAQAGYPGGRGLPPLSMRFPSADIDTRNEFDMIRAQFAAIGVRLVGTFDDRPGFAKAMDEGNFQLAYYGWYADYPDAEDFYQLLYGGNVSPGPNHGHFVDAAYDKAYEALRALADGPRRHALSAQLNAIIRDEVPLIVVREWLRVDTVQKWVGNYKRNIFASEVPYLSVDMALKTKGLP